MRTPAWETATGALGSFLNGATSAYMADLYAITLSGGAVLRYTDRDHACTVNGNTYAIGPAITRSRTRLAVGVQVDTLDLTIAADASITVSGIPMLPFIAGGGLDGARLTLTRAFASQPAQYGSELAWVGSLMLFGGRISEIDVSRYAAKMRVASDLELLDAMLPRNVYQPGCTATLFDGTCGVARSSYSASVTATGASDATRRTFSTGSGAAANYYALGWLVGASGANAGVGRTVKAFASGAFTVIQPWPNAVSPGDTFTAYAGCDKTLATCTSKFANAARFRGQPFIPAPETVI